MTIQLTTLMQQRRDTAANWTSNNPTLRDGEIGYEKDTGYIKIGDGSTAWTSLAYIDGTKVSAYPLATVDIADDAITAAKLADTSVTAGSYTTADITVDAQGRITAASSGTIGTSEISDGSITSAKLDTNIDIAGTLDVTGVGTFDSNVTIAGNLTVNGTTTTVNSTTLTVDDKNIELGSVATPTDVTADGGGITLKGATDHTIVWTNSTDSWDFSEHVNIASAKEFRIAGTKVLDATSLGSAVVTSSLTSVGTIATGVWNGTPIATAYIADDAVTAAKLADTAVTAGSYTAADITIDAQGRITAAANGAISTAEITDSAVTTAKINDDAVTAAKLADTSVTAGSYTAADITVDAQGRITAASSGTISTGEIADSAVTTAKINNDAVTAAKLADTSVSAGSYTNADITVDAQGRITAASSGSVGAIEKLSEGNTEAEVVDTGSDGHFKVTTEGVERLKIDSSGRLLNGLTSTSDSARAIFQGNSFSNSGGSIVKLSRGNATPNDGGDLGNLQFTDSGHGFAAVLSAKRDGGTWTSGSSQPTRLEFATTANGASSPTERMRIDSSGRLLTGGRTSSTGSNEDIQDSKGGIRAIPQNSQTSAYTLVVGDVGKHVNITTGGVTIPSGVFSVGDAVSIYNDSSSDQTITQGSSVTLRLAGDGTTGNKTLANYGLCTVLCVASNEFVIAGTGLS